MVYDNKTVCSVIDCVHIISDGFFIASVDFLTLTGSLSLLMENLRENDFVFRFENRF